MRTWCLAFWILPVLCPLVSSTASAQRLDSFHPLSPGDHTVELRGMKLWYKVAGTGPVCLMPTPAWGPSSDLYFRTLDSMEQYFTVVYIDSRGTGRSDRAPSLKHYTWDHLDQDLESMRIHLGQEKTWLMGHSAAGIQVLHYATKHPERVSGMVLLNTRAVLDEDYETKVQQRIARHQREPWFGEACEAFQSEPRTDHEMTRMVKSTLPLFWKDHRIAARFHDDFRATSHSAVALAGFRESRRHRVDLRPRLGQLKAPVLIVAGKDDFICCPESAAVVHQGISGSMLVLIENCGHFPWLEQPEVFRTHVDRYFTSLDFE